MQNVEIDLEELIRKDFEIMIPVLRDSILTYIQIQTRGYSYGE